MSSFAIPYAPSETVSLIPERLERITAVSLVLSAPQFCSRRGPMEEPRNSHDGRGRQAAGHTRSG
jgi:hypothetical protein